jgi:excisionase family DNA binding protein
MEVSQTVRLARFQPARRDGLSMIMPVPNTPAATLDLFLDALAERVAERLAREPRSGSKSGTQAARLLTLKEAATYLALSLSTIKKMLISGELKVVSRGGRRMIDIHDLDLWIEQHKE